MYPKAELQDIYKLFYQDFFGPAHFVTSYDSALEYLENEINSVSCCPEYKYIQDISCLNSFLRVSLQVIGNSFSKKKLLECFIASSQINLKPPISWLEHWQNIHSVVQTYFPDKAISSEFKTLSKAAEKNTNFHHSNNFRRLYSPHYRLIAKNIWQNETDLAF